jgi:hypothetical protein
VVIGIVLLAALALVVIGVVLLAVRAVLSWMVGW